MCVSYMVSVWVKEPNRQAAIYRAGDILRGAVMHPDDGEDFDAEVYTVTDENDEEVE